MEGIGLLGNQRAHQKWQSMSRVAKNWLENHQPKKTIIEKILFSCNAAAAAEPHNQSDRTWRKKSCPREAKKLPKTSAGKLLITKEVLKLILITVFKFLVAKNKLIENFMRTNDSSSYKM